MNKILDTLILTERLKLVPVSFSYTQSIFLEFTEEITELMFPSPAETVQDTENFIKRSIEKMQAETDLFVVILDKETGEFLGGGGVHGIHHSIPEFGIWIKKSAHGNKYGQEAVKGLYDWAKEYSTYEYFVYPCAKENIGSRKIAESLGGVIYKEEPIPRDAKKPLNGVFYKII